MDGYRENIWRDGNILSFIIACDVGGFGLIRKRRETFVGVLRMDDDVYG